jgi:peptide/nickel transport system substrate-binding protein
MMPTRRQLGLLPALAAGAFLPGTAAAQTPRVLNIGVNRVSVGAEPAFDVGIHQAKVVGEMFENLVEVDFDSPGRLKPVLAERWNRVDGRTVDFHLRRGVMFHNGDEMTAEDVAFTFGPERLLNADAPTRGELGRYMGPIERVEAVDRYTARVVMHADNPVIEALFAQWAAAIINRRAYLAAGSFEAWMRASVGTGPYRLRELTPGRHVILDAHAAYWGSKPHFERLVFQVVPEVSTRISGVIAGSLDIAADIPVDQLRRVQGRREARAVGGPVNNMRAIYLSRRDNPLMRDVPLRRALGLAIDRQRITRALWGGHPTVPEGMQWPTMGAIRIESRDWPHAATFDPDEARRQLATSAYRGEPLNWTLMNNYYINEVATAEAMVEMWRAVGINVRLNVVENRAQVNTAPLDLRNTSMNYDDFPDPFPILGQFGRGGFVSATHRWWQNDEVDRLGDEMMATIDPAVRKAAWHRILRLIEWDDPAVLVLHTTAAFHIARSDLAWTPANGHWPRMQLAIARR